MKKVNYPQYLKSEHWSNKKAQHFNKAPSRRKCFVCGTKDNLHVHHNTYENIGKEKLQDLVTLCGNHHFEVHTIQKQFKVDYRFAVKMVYTAFKYKNMNYNEVKRGLDEGYYTNLEDRKNTSKNNSRKEFIKRWEDKFTYKCASPALS